MKLENWCITIHPKDRGNLYAAPESLPPCLGGNVNGHPTRPDGERIVTSPIIGRTKEEHAVTENGSVYELGTINPEYLEKYPDALEKMKSWPEVP
jgi:hypothetical protein